MAMGHVMLFIHILEQLSLVPELNNLGPLFKSSNLPLELTESETEYVVRCVKHTFAHHMVFQVTSHFCIKFKCLIIELVNEVYMLILKQPNLFHVFHQFGD